MSEQNNYQSGANPIGVQVTNTPIEQQNMQFDNYQLQQFQIAESEYGNIDSEIKKHPEWSGTFMNYFLHAEGKGEGLRPFYEVADWLHKHPLPSDAGGQIGCSSTVFSNLLEIYRLGHSLPENLPLTSTGEVDEFMFQFQLIRDKLKYKGHPQLISGRLCMNDINLLEDDYVLAEGNREAYEIFCSLGSMSQHNFKGPVSPGDRFGQIANNIWANTSIKLGFDDMNIRGIQILDALEYADGSIQKLYEHMSQPFPNDTRDPNIYKYCNMKAAQRIRDKVSTSEYIAVSGGASMDKQDMKDSMLMGYRNPELIPYRYKMSVLNYMEYLEDIQPIKTDWSKIDIISNTRKEEAIKAAEARGFKVICTTGTRDRWGDTCQAIMMYNDKTGAFIHMPMAQDSNACYGGCSMDFWSKQSIPWQMLQHASGGGLHHYEGMIWHQVTYNEGLFSSYDNITDMLSASEIDWNKLGFVGLNCIPVPQYYEKPFNRENELAIEVGFPLAHMMCDMGGYRMQCMLNTLIAHYDQSIDCEACPQYSQIKDDNIAFAAAAYHLSTWSLGDVEESLKLCRLAKLYLKMPDEEYAKLIAAVRNQMKERDERELSRINDPQNPDFVKQRLKSEFRSLDDYCVEHIQLAYGFDNDELLVEKAVIGEDRPLEVIGVKLPWM